MSHIDNDNIIFDNDYGNDTGTTNMNDNEDNDEKQESYNDNENKISSLFMF